jgi:hypothetical protein
LIIDLIEQLTNVEIAYKLESSAKEEMQKVEVMDDQIKFETHGFKCISKEFPIQ